MATTCQYNALKYLYSLLYFITARDNIYRALYHVYCQCVFEPQEQILTRQPLLGMLFTPHMLLHLINDHAIHQLT